MWLRVSRAVNSPWAGQLHPQLWLLLTVFSCACFADAQTIATDLEDPIAIVANATSTYVLEHGGPRVRDINDSNKLLLEDFLDDGVASKSITMALYRDALTMVNVTDSAKIRLTTFLLGEAAPTHLSKLSGELESHGLNIQSAVATKDAVYLLTTNATNRWQLVRVPFDRLENSIGESSVLADQTSSPKPAAVTISPEGNVVVAGATNSQAVLSFYHAHSGQRLLHLTLQMKSVHALAYAPSGQLLAAGELDDRSFGIFRLDVAFEGTQQFVRPTKLAQLENIVDLTCPEPGRCFALVGGGTKGRVVQITLP